MAGDEQSTPIEKGTGPSWAWMLAVLVAAIAVAAVIAYRMIYPFFHQHPR